ncbi:MAG: B12-binding domain-containing radical SAM protein [Acidobacteria bacterium]|nr:MAG: B12-binding domain-containing radical SAM protein [Acidobacteriota bacterium]
MQVFESVWPQLERLLPRVRKPARYIGGEKNLIAKAHEGAEQVKFLLAFPDAYEIGQPNLGLAILYELLNERDDCLAERTYAPWPDLEEQMRSQEIPLFSVDTHMPAAAFDVLAFTLPSELLCTNVLNMIDLAGLPVRSSDRLGSHPLVIAGGHGAFNPEPLSEFIDAFAVGDGEEVAVEIADVIRRHRADESRESILRDLASVPGVYVPACPPSGLVEKRVVASLADYPYPKKPLVPVTEVVHDRLSVEIFRGCQRSCRFCQAGMVTRPTRERPAEQIKEMVRGGLASTGFEDVSLLSLSSADYSGIAPLLADMVRDYSSDKVSLSLPSLRVDAFTVGLAADIQEVKRTGLTFAPEAGTWRLRQVINKTVTDADLFSAVEGAFSQGWRRIKLYFMIGLPTETDDDVVSIAKLGRAAVEIGRKYHKGASVTLSVGAFVPKAHTPFQWAAMDRPEEIFRKVELLKGAAGDRSVNLRWQDPRTSVVEGIISRGDARIGNVIEAVWRKGGVFQEWSEYFDAELWLEAMADEGLSADDYCFTERSRDDPLPWAHIYVGVYSDWLWNDWQSAIAEAITEDCRWSDCYDCGVCMEFGVENVIGSGRPRVRSA